MGKPLNGKPADNRHPSKKWLVNLLLSIFVAVLTISGLMALDRIVGPRILQHRKNLVYGAYDRARMSSTEFDVTYQMNNLGFRGPNISLEKGDKERIVFIGDSFTFGWGVSQNRTWIGQLQKLHPRKELLNLGRGGDHPMDHVQHARKVLPILKPDRLIICLLQWNDLFQMHRVMNHEKGAHEPSFPKNDQELKTPFYRSVFQKLFPNLSSIYRAPASINTFWYKEAQWILTQMNLSQKANYKNLEKQVRTAFENGKLNPWILYEGVFHGESYTKACSGEMDSAIVRISHHLLELENLAMENNCQLEILLLPYRPANCPACLADLKNLGYTFSDQETCAVNSMLETRLPGLISASVHSFSSWEHAPDSVHSWYFPLDGHLTEKGNTVVGLWADLVLLQ